MFLGIPLKHIIIYIFLINLIGFCVMGWDKKQAILGKWRISEKTLFMITFFGGGFGTIAGMYVFHHKTKKLRFVIGLPMILLIEIGLVIYSF